MACSKTNAAVDTVVAQLADLEIDVGEVLAELLYQHYDEHFDVVSTGNDLSA